MSRPSNSKKFLVGKNRSNNRILKDGRLAEAEAVKMEMSQKITKKNNLASAKKCSNMS